MIKKYFCLILILSICLFSLSGCYDAKGVEDWAYAIAIGLDKGEKNNIKLNIQFATTSSSSGNSGGSSSGGSTEESNQSSSTKIISVDSSTIDSGINIINNYVSKKINLSHCQVIVISEELAKEGIAEYIYSLIDNVQVRPSCNIIVSKGSAHDFLDKASKTLEKMTARYYETAIKSEEYTAYTSDVDLNEFFSSLKSNAKEPIAALGKADENLEYMGLAVFKKNKLVGEVNGTDAICYAILSKKLDNCMISVPNPASDKYPIDINLSQHCKPDIKVKMIDEKPNIDIKIDLDGYVTSSNEDIEHSSPNISNDIQNATNEYLKSSMYSFLYKTSKELKSDIVGFGKYIVPTYLTWEDWKKSDWLSNYENSNFNVEVKVNIKSAELFSAM